MPGSGRIAAPTFAIALALMAWLAPGAPAADSPAPESIPQPIPSFTNPPRPVRQARPSRPRRVGRPHRRRVTHNALAPIGRLAIDDVPQSAATGILGGESSIALSPASPAQLVVGSNDFD